MHRLLEESKKIKSQADAILKESGVVEILKNYGKVKIGGSYALDVMLRPDLDFFVITPKHDIKKVGQIASELINNKYFHIIHFGNWFEFKPNINESWAEQGYYFAVFNWIDGIEWKSDIWLITSDQDKTAQTTGHYKKLLNQESDNAKRVIILEIKEAMKQSRKYIKGVDGKLIYKAVLENGVTTPKDFEEFLRKQK